MLSETDRRDPLTRPWAAQRPEPSSAPPPLTSDRLREVLSDSVVSIAIAAVIAAALGLATTIVGGDATARSVVRVEPYVLDGLTQGGRDDGGTYQGLATEARSDAVFGAAGLAMVPPMTVQDVRDAVDISQIGNGAVLQVLVTDADPDRARRLADEVASAVLAQRVAVAQASIDETLAQIDEDRASLDAEIADLERSLGASGIVSDLVSSLTREVAALEATRAVTDPGTDLDEPIRSLLQRVTQLQGELPADYAVTESRLEALLRRAEDLASLDARVTLAQPLPGEIVQTARVEQSGGPLTAAATTLAFGAAGAAAMAVVAAWRGRNRLTSHDLGAVAPVVARIWPAELDAATSPASLGPELRVAMTQLLSCTETWGPRTMLLALDGVRQAGAVVSRLAMAAATSSRFTQLEVIDLEEPLDGTAPPIRGVRSHGIGLLSGDPVLRSLTLAGPATTTWQWLETLGLHDDVVLVVDTRRVTPEELTQVVEAVRLVGVPVAGIVELRR